MSKRKVIDVAREVIRIESEAVAVLEDRIDEKFEAVVNQIIKCKGRLIVCGVGKSGLISQKIASTMSSTGTPSQFVHPSEAIHGDLGMITSEDVFMIISNSGETLELLQLIPSVKTKEIPIIGLIGKQGSTLAQESSIWLDTSVEKEACTLELAPTASTTATLALGDALAISTLELRGFGKKDFAKLHPGGMLGKRLLYTVDKISHKGSKVPLVSYKISIRETLFIISEKGLGLTGVLDDNGKIIGIITDGDIRRGLEELGNKILDAPAESIMTAQPKWVLSSTLVIAALETMEKHSITSLFVYSEKNTNAPYGIVHIHDILNTGIK
tara:strand:- start:951 stop:1931 length:981 start_codon:yes stop_codon:yes gene_type:complete